MPRIGEPPRNLGEPPGKRLGGLGEALNMLLGGLGTTFGRPWWDIWAHVGWGHLGGLGGPFGLILGALGVIFGALGVIWDASVRHLGSFWEFRGLGLESWGQLFDPWVENCDVHENLCFP